MKRAIGIVFWTSVAVVCCVVFHTLGSSNETLNIAVVFLDGLGGYLGIEAATVGGALRQENREDGTVWVNDLFEIHVTREQVDGQKLVKLHVVSSSETALGINTVSLRVLVPAAGIDGVWTPSGHISDDRLISADPGSEFVTYSSAHYGIPYLAAATAPGRNLVT